MAIDTTFVDFQTVVPADWLNNVNEIVNETISVRQPRFGAKGDGVTDDTAAIQAAINFALSVNGTLYFPNGTYLISSTLTISASNHLFSIRGDGKYTTTIITNSPTLDVFAVTLPTFEMKDIGINASVTRTAGNHINSNCNQSYYSGILIQNHILGILNNDNIGTYRDLEFSQTLPFGISMTIMNAQGGMVVDNMLCTVSTLGTPTAGIKIVNAGAVQLTNSNIVSQGFDLWIAPGVGQFVGAVYAENTYFDTAEVGIVIAPTGGTVQRCRFASCWTCSHSQHGVLIENSGAGSIGGIHFIDHMAQFCTNDGLLVVPSTGTLVTDLSIIGGTFAQNSTGIGLAAGQTDFTIMGATIGMGGGAAGNASTGVFLPNGASDHYIISNNRVRGNTVAAITDGGTGSNKFVGNNIT